MSNNSELAIELAARIAAMKLTIRMIGNSRPIEDIEELAERIYKWLTKDIFTSE